LFFILEKGSRAAARYGKRIAGCGLRKKIEKLPRPESGKLKVFD